MSLHSANSEIRTPAPRVSTMNLRVRRQLDARAARIIKVWDWCVGGCSLDGARPGALVCGRSGKAELMRLCLGAKPHQSYSSLAVFQEFMQCCDATSSVQLSIMNNVSRRRSVSRTLVGTNQTVEAVQEHKRGSSAGEFMQRQRVLQKSETRLSSLPGRN